MPLKKKIIFTERDLKNIYNQEVKIIFLNNWYYLNFKKNIKNLKYEVLKHYSYTSDEQHYHHLQCEQIYEKVILELGVEFNKLHNLNYSNKGYLDPQYHNGLADKLQPDKFKASRYTKPKEKKYYW